MKDCIFCNIAAHKVPANIEFEDDDVVAFDSINQAAGTHILIIPKKHVDTFMELAEEVVKMKNAAQELIKKMGIENAYKLAFNGGKYQSVPHVHLHLLGGDLENEKDILNKL